jgi:hypothetical protein
MLPPRPRPRLWLPRSLALVLLTACGTDDEGGGSEGGDGGATSSSASTSVGSMASGSGGAGGAGGTAGSGAAGLTCEEACLEESPEWLRLYGPLYLCVGCLECYDQCGGATDSNCSGPPSTAGACDMTATSCPACLQCAQAVGAACHDEAVACNESQECSALVKCLNVCVAEG